MARGYKEYENTVVLAQLELKQDFSFITQGLNGRLLGNVSRESYYDLYRAYVPFYYTIGIYDKATDEYTLSAINPESGTDYLGYTQGAKTISSSIYMEAALSYDRIFRDRHNVSGLLSSPQGRASRRTKALCSSLFREGTSASQVVSPMGTPTDISPSSTSATMARSASTRATGGASSLHSDLDG